MRQWPVLNPNQPNQLLEFTTSQLDFATSRSFATLFAGGWGSGKTISGLAFLTLSAALNPPRTQGMVLLPTFPMMQEYLELVLLPAFEKILIHHDIGRRVLHLPGGRRLLYRSGFVAKRIQMSNLAYLLLDEPHLMEEQVFLNAQARARQAGSKIRLGLTSLPKIGWLSREFDGKDDTFRRCLHARTEDNRFNDPDFYNRMVKACPARMAPCYLGGEFVPDGDTVWPEHNRKVHVIPWSYTPEVRGQKGETIRTQLGLAIDWSARRPHVLFIAKIPAGAVLPGPESNPRPWVTQREVSIIVDELYPDGRYSGGITVARLCELIKKRRSKITGQSYPFEYAVCDPAGRQMHATARKAGESEVVQAKQYLGVPMLYLHNQLIRIGIQHVKLALEPLMGHPFLLFSSDLLQNVAEPIERSVLRSVEGYSYKPERHGILDEEPDHDDVFSHACDCVRYWITYFYAEDRLSGRVWSAA